MKNWKPKFIYNDKFLDIVGIFFKINGISLFPFVVMRTLYLQELPSGYWQRRRKKTENHETIHYQQQLEMLVIPFYVLYILEYFVKFFIYGFNLKKAYYNISFEKEAFANDTNLEYLKTRKRYNWIKLIF